MASVAPPPADDRDPEAVEPAVSDPVALDPTALDPAAFDPADRRRGVEPTDTDAASAEADAEAATVGVIDFGDPAMPRLRDPAEIPEVDLAAAAAAALAESASPPTTVDDGWREGAKIRLGQAAFLLQTPVTSETAPDGGHQLRRARARQLTPVHRDVWLIQAHAIRDTATTRRVSEDLTAQGALLGQLRGVPDLPQLIDLVPTPGDLTLLIGHPDARGLTEVFGGAPYPLFVLESLWHGLPPLCASLGALHARGFAHGVLTPETLLVTPDGRIVLRDLGRAACRAVPRAADVSGPAEDVRQLAALIYELAVGEPPAAVPVPPSALRSDVAHLDELLLPALATDPAARPPLPRLARRLRSLALPRSTV